MTLRTNEKFTEYKFDDYLTNKIKPDKHIEYSFRLDTIFKDIEDTVNKKLELKKDKLVENIDKWYRKPNNILTRNEYDELMSIINKVFKED